MYSGVAEQAAEKVAHSPTMNLSAKAATENRPVTARLKPGPFTTGHKPEFFSDL
jgi:hypothetical protein